MKKWIFSLVFILTFIQAYASQNQINCKKVGTNTIQECILTADKDQTTQVYGINNMPYALCSQTACTPTEDKNVAHCECVLENYKDGWKSFSLSPTEYESAKPTYDVEGHLQTVQSNYSMANLKDFKVKANQTCHYQQERAWADCYGVRCELKEKVVNDIKQLVPICRCPIEHNKTFMIGATGKSACEQNTIWSAITDTSFEAFGANPMILLYQKAYPQSPPITDK